MHKHISTLATFLSVQLCAFSGGGDKQEGSELHLSVGLAFQSISEGNANVTELQERVLLAGICGGKDSPLGCSLSFPTEQARLFWHSQGWFTCLCIQPLLSCWSISLQRAAGKVA